MSNIFQCCFKAFHAFYYLLRQKSKISQYIIMIYVILYIDIYNYKGKNLTINLLRIILYIIAIVR
jgi:hypothetical protein